MFRAGFIQNSPLFGEKDKNFNDIFTLTKGCSADFLVLPELFATGYAFSSGEELLDLAEPAEGKTLGFLRSLAGETGAVIVAGFPERTKEGVYNSALAADSKGIICLYRKIHLFNTEKNFFLPGNTPFRVFKVKEVPVGMMICFDWVFPEAARSLALLGARVIAHPSNLVLPFCQKAMVTRSLENRIFAITANRVGRELRRDQDLTFTGQSQITDPAGNLMIQGCADKKEIQILELDWRLAENKKITPRNDIFADLRPEFYLKES